MNNRRIGFVRDIAYDVLIKSGIEVFPFSIYKLIRQLDKVNLFSFKKTTSVLKKYLNKQIAVDEVPEILGSDEAITFQLNDEYYVFYNDDITKKTPQRIRFTLAHELGHITLRHFDSDKCYLGRNSISQQESLEMEKEADLFATELLAPKAIIDPQWSEDDISINFDISKSASNNIYDFCQRNPWIYRPFALPDYYFCPNTFNICKVSPTLSVLPPHYFYCQKCSSIINGYKKINRCIFCNGKLIEEKNIFEFRELKGREIMNYSGIAVDMNGIANVCPRCGNENTQHYKYCEICGAMLINQCTGSINPYCNPKDFEDLRFSCEDGQHLSGQARYCPFCGSVSTFYIQKLLNDYTKEKSNIENNESFISDINSTELPPFEEAQ